MSCSPNLFAQIPPTISFEDASVIPLGISTASCGLFQKDHLSLQFPTEPRAASTGQTVLIWSGSSGVGSNAIQLAAPAEYEVFTTASPKNFDYVKTLGASQVWYYRSPTIVEDIIAAFKGRISPGALAIGDTSCARVGEIVSRIDGRKFISLANPPTGGLPAGIESRFIFGGDLKDNEVGPAIFDAYLPKVLVAGTYKIAPPAEVVGKGLGAVQKALDDLHAGVSAKKFVVSL